tara:strand:- start:964 stop:1374 length:411 start_codon:yes stop_codon:yes gene_type:complete
MKITKNNIHDLAKSILFENNINELRLPLDHDMDAGKNNRTSALDQPGPQIDGDGNYKKSWEENLEELPLTPSDVMPVIYDEKISSAALEDDSYSPNNTSELMKASNTLLNNYKEDLDSEHISLVWKTLKKIISKVK